MDPEASVDASEFNFSQIKSFTSLLKNISLGPGALSQDVTNADSSLGLLPSTSDSSLQLLSSPPSRELTSTSGPLFDPKSTSAMCEPAPGEASLGQYLQPVQLGCEETDEDEVSEVQNSTENETQVRPSSAALADLDRLYAKFSTSETEESSSSEQEEKRENSTKNFLGWEQLLAQAESEVPDSFSQENPAISSFYQDPSFCSGKFSARSTSFGGSVAGSTRDENFSDFSKPQSFQASYVSNFSEALDCEQGSVQLGSFPTTSSALPPFHQLKAQLRVSPATPVPESQVFDWPSPEFAPHLGSSDKKAPLNPFDQVDPQTQPENPFDASQPRIQQGTGDFQSWVGVDLSQGGEEDFGDFGGQGNVMDFLAQEEEACLQENPFLEEEACEAPVNSSVFSGVSDKSIVLRNSGLWAGDTSNVDLVQLRREEEVRLSRCEYFRHNSSRLGSLDDDLKPGQRPEFGFFHHIRSPERKPLSLLPEKKQDSLDAPPEVASTFSLGRNSSLSPTSSSGPSSADTTTCLPSGESTKTVVSMLPDTDTVKAEELAGRLENLASQLLLSSPRRIQATPHRADQTSSMTSQPELNLSTISRVLSDASVSSDPQHFVNAILGCLDRAKKTSNAKDESRESTNADEGSKLLDMTSPASATEWRNEQVSKPKQVVKPIRPFGQTNSANTPVVLPTRSIQSPALPPVAEEVDQQARLSQVLSSICHPSTQLEKMQQAEKESVLQQPQSAPSSRTPTPPPLTKSSSLPASLHTSTISTPGGGKRRKPSGARHSSPIKSAAPTLPLPSPNTPDLSMLGNKSYLGPNPPNMMQVASTSHLATSTPFHADLNLSSVILDHVALNQSANPAPPIPAPQVSNLGMVELHLPPSKASEVSIPKEVNLDQVTCTNHQLCLDLPLTYQLQSLEARVDLIVKVTSIQLGDVQVPEDHWEEVVKIQKEWRTRVNRGDPLQISLVPLQPGLVKVGIAVISSPLTPPMSISNTLISCQVESPNIQVLTENGESLDFGSLAEDCLSEQQLVLVNCGRSEVSLQLKLNPGVFSFEGNKLEALFKLPGVQFGGEANGVAKTTTVSASTIGIDGGAQQVHMAQMEVLVGEGCLVGSLPARVKVGRARMKVREAGPIVFQCRAGETSRALVNLYNAGNMKLVLRLHMAASSEGVFNYPNSLVLEPESSKELDLKFTASKDISGPRNVSHCLELASQPCGPNHQVTLHTVITSNPPSYLSASKPTLSVGLLKKAPEERKPEPKKFPVECDRAVVNFICVKPGKISEQKLALRNSTQELVTLTAIVRESSLFSLLGPRGAVASISLQLQPGETQELAVRHSPREIGESKAKLVLKPQGQRMDGKAFKASIGLVGLSGKFNVELEGTEVSEESNDILVLRSDTFPATKTIKFVNKGDLAAFVRVAPERGSSKEVEMSLSWKEVVLAKGEQKELLVSLPSSSGNLTVWRGPEVARQILKKAAKISGSALGDQVEDWSNKVEGEEKLNEVESWCGGRLVTLHDLRHFPILLAKTLIRVAPPAVSLGSWAGLEVEETLSDTRLEQSIIRCSPPTREQQSPSLSILPRSLHLVWGGEDLLRLTNKSNATLSWELPEPPAVIQVQPSAGVVAAGGEAVVCVRALDGQAEFRGTLHLYCDNTMEKVDVLIAAASPILVAPPHLHCGTAVTNSPTSCPLLLSNQGSHMVQWKVVNLAVISASSFSLPHTSGLLNPGQSVSVAVQFAPKSHGTHTVGLVLSCSLLQGGGQVKQTTVQLQGECIPLTKAVSSQSKPSHSTKKCGGLSLENSNLVFPNTRIGETSVAKVKIKNRSHNDQAVAFQPLSQSSPFRVVQALVEVKSNCYVTVPIQFQPRVPGEVVQELRLRWNEGDLTAILRGCAV